MRELILTQDFKKEISKLNEELRNRQITLKEYRASVEIAKTHALCVIADMLVNLVEKEGKDE